jgi:hypothetical protein
MFMLTHLNKLIGGLCLCLSLSASASSLFDGKNSDLWLVDINTGAITGYNYDQWLDSFADAAMPLDSTSEVGIVNNVENSSLPMTPLQPALSLVGLEEGDSDTSQSIQSSLRVEPASGTYEKTINVQMMVDSSLIQAGGATLNWQINAGPVQTLPLEPALLIEATLTNGYFVQKLTFVSSATLNVTIKDAGAVVISEQNRSYTINPTHKDGVRRDSDGDGLPDVVEAVIGLDALESDWQHDSDSDGWSDFDEWLRSGDIDPDTGMPRDSDDDGWSDFDEILRGTNHLDPEPQIDGAVIGDPQPGDPLTIPEMRFCTADDVFYFNLKFENSADELIFGIGADNSVFTSITEVIRVNFDQNGEVTRQEPIVRTSSTPPNDRWQDGPITDFTIEPLAAGQFHVYGSVPVGANPFLPGDEVKTVTIRYLNADSNTVYDYYGPTPVSGDIADCQQQVTPSVTNSELVEQQRLRFKDFPSARRLYEVESIINGSLNPTPAVAGMVWSQVRADDINGQQYYDSKKLLTDDEINLVSLDPQAFPGRARQVIADQALLADLLPDIRVPAGDSMVITALHEKAHLTQVYKHWVNRAADLTPLQFYQDHGAGTWNTAEEWKTAYINYLSGLVVPHIFAGDIEQSTVAVSIMEAFISQEARFYNNYAAIQLFGNDANAINGELINTSEDALVSYIGVRSSFDDLMAVVNTLIENGQPLFDIRNWVLQVLNSPVDNERTDQSIAERFIKSFDEDALDCFIEQEYLDQLNFPGNDTALAEFNSDCLVFHVVTDPQESSAAQLQAYYAADQQRLYQLRLLLIPDGYAQYLLDQGTATPTLHDMAADTDSDDASNKEELFRPLADVTLPWSDDRDLDGINDGADPCPFDPENLCSQTPVLPSVITTDSVTVHEPETGETFVLISFILDKPSDEDVTIYYQTQAGLNDQTADASDFVEVINGQVTIDAGETVALVKILIKADGDIEGAEEFTVSVTSVDNANISMFSSTVVTINDPVAAPPGGGPTVPAVAALTFEPVKTFHFSWADVPDATHYRLMENPDGSSGFTQVGSDIPQGIQSINQIVALYDRINAVYILQSCNADGCKNSPDIPVTGTLADSIGYFKASNAGAGDKFGDVLAISGDGLTLAVGAAYEAGSGSGINPAANDSAIQSGAVYLYRFDGANWTEEAYIKASNPERADLFGYSLDLSDDGNTLVVGSLFEDSGTTGVNSTPDETGYHSGAAYLFRFDGSDWFQQAYIKASNTSPGDEFSYSVAISGDGNTLAVGAIQEDGSGRGINPVSDELASSSGAVYLFRFDGSNWFEQSYIKSSNSNGIDRFGQDLALSVDGNTLAVVTTMEDGSGRGINPVSDELAGNSGAAYLFRFDGSNWFEQAYIKSSNSESSDGFGSDVSLSNDGNILAVGASGEDSSTVGVNSIADELASSSGAAYIFRFEPQLGFWYEEAYIKASNTGGGDNFGLVLDLSSDGTTLIVGAENEDSSSSGVGSNWNEDTINAGAAYLFRFDGSNWLEQAYIKASITDIADNFATAVAISGNGETAVVGASGEDSATTGINGDATDDSASSSGAVYVY